MGKQKINSNNTLFLDNAIRENLNIETGDTVETVSIKGGMFVVKDGTSTDIAIECLQSIIKEVERKKKIECNLN